MANQILTAPGTAITFTDATADAVITLNNLAAGAARVSARYDKGVGSKVSLWRIIATIQFDTAPAQYETVEVYVLPSDGTNAAGNPGTADAALDVDALRNAGPPVCVITAEEAAADDTFTAMGVAYIPDRYFSVAVYNRSAADPLQATNDISKVIAIPMPDEIQ